MSEFTWSENSGESSNEDDESEKKKEREAKAKRLGTLSSHSAEKNTKEDGEKKEKSLLESFFDEEKKPESEEEDTHITDGAAPESANESEPTPEEVEAAKLEALKEQIDENIPKFESELAAATPGSVEYEDALAKLETEKKLRTKAEAPDDEADPLTEAEFAKRKAEIGKEEVEPPDEEREHDTFPQDFEIHEPNQNPVEAVEDEPVEPFTSPLPPVPVPTTPPPTPIASAPTPTVPSPAQTHNWPTQPAITPPVGSIGGAPNTASAPEATTPPPLTTSAEAKERDDNTTRKPRSGAGAFLLGYTVGRHRGRKRTEKRLQPEIDTLKKEKAETKQKLKQQEVELSQHVKKHHSAEAEKSALKQELAVQEASKIEIEPPTERPPVAPKPAKEVVRHAVSAAPEVVSETPAAAESTQETFANEEPVKAREHAAPITETTVVNIFNNQAVEQTERKPERVQTTNQDIRRVEQLSTPEILKRAEMLYISGVSVKELYNANRIDRRGLVKIVQESMRGHDIKPIFEKVELGKERQRERAREFRHDDTGKPSSARKSTSVNHVKPLGHTLLHDVRPAEEHETVHAPLNVPATPDSKSLESFDLQQAEEALAATSAPKPKQRSVVAPILAVVVIAVALIVVYLLIQANL